jgi:DNA-binding CsgD family transcriptional regulator/tetratricopeptide (TPR) repeat protein
MGELDQALADSLSGHGHLVVLAGEPGIGKTRIAVELARRAESQGAKVLWGRCYEEEGAPIYWPWIQLLRSYLQQADTDQIRRGMGTGAADIAAVLPEVRDRLTDLDPSPPLDNPEASRFRFSESLTSFLVTASRTSPLLLVLDDLHWADRPSLLLLPFLVRKLADSRILVVGSYRDNGISLRHPLSNTLAELARESTFRRQVLRGISEQDAARLIQYETAAIPPPAAVAIIHGLTGGNLFFLTEVVKLLAERGDLGQAANSIAQGTQIPLGVREAVGQRLNRRSEHCNRMLTTASVIGREFSLELIARLIDDVSDDRLLEILEEALATGMIEASPESADHYQFTHALVRNTLVNEVSAARRIRLHARIADALEIVYGGNSPEIVTTLAYHLAEAMTMVDPDKLVRFSLLAGVQALDAYAPEEAMVYLERGLAAKQGQPLDADMAVLLTRLAQAQIAVSSGQGRQEALNTLSLAFNSLVQLGDFHGAVKVAEMALPTGVGILEGAGELIYRALQLVAPDSLEAGRLQVRNGWDLGRSKGDYQGALDAFNQALFVALQYQDRDLEMDALAASAEIDVFHLHCRESVEKSLRAISLAREKKDLRAQVQARQRATLALTIIGDLGEARRQAEAALVPAQKLRDIFWWSSSLWSNQFVHRLRGDWLRSRDYGDRALEISPFDKRVLADRVLLEYQLGNFGQGEEYIGRMLESHGQERPSPTTGFAIPAVVLPLIALYGGPTEHTAVAQATAESIVSAAVSASPLIVSMARTGLALLAVAQADGEAALEHYNALLPQRGTMVQAGLMSIDRLLGNLARTLGDHDRAIDHLGDAVVFCDGAGYRVEFASSCHECAELLLLRNTPGDRERAGDLIEEAKSQCVDLGLIPLHERLNLLLTQIEPRPAPAAGYPDGLTRREVEVLRLVAAGKTNPEIGVQLYISSRTVATHVSNILTKISAANRAEAATYAARGGLL